MNYNTIKNYILYQVIDESNGFAYIGSSGLHIVSLEYNHRNFRLKDYKETRFRKALETIGKDWKFSILYEGRCSREEIEYLEGIAIRAAKPIYNDDYFPLESSKKYGRI
jgi:hypothetical protein